MRLIIAGCEYAGASTLATAIADWSAETLGLSVPVHDVFRMPHIAPFEMTDEEVAQFMALPIIVRQCYQWHSFTAHLMSDVLERDSYIYVGFQLDEAVYAPLYYGYGGKGEYAERSALARAMEEEIMKKAPDTVLILLRARPEVIARRMRENPHRRPVVQEQDIEHVLQRFEEEFQDSLLRRKFALDTSDVTVEQTLAEFAENLKPHLTQADQLRLLAHQSWPQE